MSRLLKDCLQQHSTPGVVPYDQIESVTLVDAKWTQSVQTPNPVALMEFPGRIWPLLAVFKAADRGMTQEVVICRVKMFCCWWSFKPTVSPVITMAIHTFVQWAFGFSYVLFIADRWEKEPYVVVEQPHADIPVYVVKWVKFKSLKRPGLCTGICCYHFPVFLVTSKLETRSSAIINLLRMQTRWYLHQMVMINSIWSSLMITFLHAQGDMSSLWSENLGNQA